MKKVISASRRSDLVAFFPEWLAVAIRGGRTLVFGPSGRAYAVDLRPEKVHTFVLWSKDFGNLLENAYGLKDALARYNQLYFHFTVTGLGGSFIERGVLPYREALAQISPLVRLAGHPERVSLRFDPVVFWKEEKRIRTNISFFESAAMAAADVGIRDIRFSFAQWYGKALRRAGRLGFRYHDPPLDEKMKLAGDLAQYAGSLGLRLSSCAQDFLAEVPAIVPSSCIDGRLFKRLHPSQEAVSLEKDKTQRRECCCTESVDIGSYSQSCPHSCIYCYANPRVG